MPTLTHITKQSDITNTRDNGSRLPACEPKVKETAICPYTTEAEKDKWLEILKQNKTREKRERENMYFFPLLKHGKAI